jgi:hypothetical protein
MIKIYKPNKNYFACLVCGKRQTDSEAQDIFALEFLDRYKQGTSLHLCKDCCKELRSLLKFTQLKGIKMVSIDDVDK